VSLPLPPRSTSPGKPNPVEPGPACSSAPVVTDASIVISSRPALPNARMRFTFDAVNSFDLPFSVTLSLSPTLATEITSSRLLPWIVNTLVTGSSEADIN
jgi:hypothetical protein